MSSPSTNSVAPRRWQVVLRAVGVPLFMASLYALYVVVNSWGIPTETLEATVIDKQCYESFTTYDTRIVAGRSWVRSSQSPLVYAITMSSGAKTLVGYVDLAQFERMEKGQVVIAKVKRKRLTSIAEVVQIQPSPSKER